MNNKIVLANANHAQVVNWEDPQIIQTIKNTVAKDATDVELKLFAEICRSSGLNPFRKEIWFIKTAKGPQIMTGINGFLAIANANPAYDGLECEIDDEESPTRAICKVYRKDRKYPSTGVALMREYRKDLPLWKNMPNVMLTKCAKANALREAFPQQLGGMYIPEEMPSEFSVKQAEQRETIDDLNKTLKALKPKPAPSNEETLVKMVVAFEKHGIDKHDIENLVCKKIAEFDPKDITSLREVYEDLESGIDPATIFNVAR